MQTLRSLLAVVQPRLLMQGVPNLSLYRYAVPAVCVVRVCRVACTHAPYEALPRQQQRHRAVLRVVRVWAQRRQIYGARFGYLGGISWACMVAFVCRTQRPDSHPSDTLLELFEVLTTWRWKDQAMNLSTGPTPEVGYPRPAARILPPLALTGTILAPGLASPLSRVAR